MNQALLLACVAATICGTAIAQAPTVRPAPERGSNNCAPTESMPREGSIAPQGTTTGQRSEQLGDKLAKSDGVLCPPAGVDPGMHAPTPDAGNTPVIPPPGSPGGDSTIRPK